MRYYITCIFLLFVIVAQEQSGDISFQKTEQANLLLKEGKQLFENDKPEEAVKILKEAITIYQKYPNASINECYDLILKYYYDKTSNWAEAEKYSELALKDYFFDKKLQKNDLKYIRTLRYVADSHERQVGKFDTAKVYYKQAIALAENLKPLPKQELGSLHHNASFGYQRYMYLEEALYHAKQSYKYWKDIKPEANTEIRNLYSNLSKIYRQLNAIDLADAYRKKALRISKEVDEYYSWDYAVSLGNMAGFQSGNGFIDESIKYNKEAIDILLTLPENRNNTDLLSTLLNNLGRAYGLQEKNKLSEKTLLKAIKYNKRNVGAYINLANLYITSDLKQYDKAIECLSEVEPIAKEISSLYYTPIYVVKAKAYVQKNDFENAFEHFQWALNLYLGNEKNAPLDKYALLSLDDIPNNDITRKVFKNRTNLIQAYAMKTNKIEDWEMAFEHSLFSIEMFEDYYRMIPYLQKTKSDEIKTVYEKSIEIGLMLYEKTDDASYLERTFQLSEQFKGNEILTGLNAAKAKKTISLPKDLLEKEKEVRTQLTYFKKQLFKAKKAKNTEEIKANEDELTHWQLEFEALMKTFKRDYPNYFDLKYEKAPIKISEIQTQILAPKQALVEYFIGNDALYIWNIQKNKTHFYQKANPQQIDTLVEAVRLAVTDTEARRKAPEATFSNYTSNAATLSNLLLDAIQKEENVNRLMIIPDDKLGYLPFEILLTKSVDTKTPNYKNLPYLIEDYSVSYAYASKLLLYERKKSGTQYLAAFAPAYEQFAEADTLNSNSLAMLVRDGEAKLPGALNETKTIAEKYNGEVFTGRNATEENFKKNASKYKILHLSMHALMDEEFPMRSHLVFESMPSEEDNMLQIGELYNMEIPADLVVLSACNSGFGKIRTGEGVQSLATAFNYAGTKSTVMSLWKVPDQSTAPIMVNFYEELHKKKTKDESLRQAKLNYLDETVADELSHPLYWAGFIASGDMSPIYEKRNQWIWWLVGLGSLSVVGFLFFQRRKIVKN